MRVPTSFVLACAALAIVLTGPLSAQGAADSASKSAKPAKPAVGGKFPDFALPDVAGKSVSLSDFKGKAIILSFWSCYTDTCYRSVPVIKELLAQYADRGLVAPTVCSEVPPALEENGYEGLLKNCGTGQVVLIDKRMKVAQSLGITEFPTTFLIDRNYAVWQIITGVRPLMQEDFRLLVKSLVAE